MPHSGARMGKSSVVVNLMTMSLN